MSQFANGYMFKFFEKYKLQYHFLTLIAFGFGCYFELGEYFSSEATDLKDPKMKLMGGIIFGVFALLKIADIVELLERKTPDKMDSVEILKAIGSV